MASNNLPPHTDTVPHFGPLRNTLFEIHETALPHTVATLGGGMVLLHLDDELTKEHLPSNGVYGGGDIHPTPIYSDEWVAYGQTRGFRRYNIRTHEFHDHLVCTKLEEVLSACRALDPEKNIFAFMIANLEKPGSTQTRYFKIFDLRNEEPLLLAKIEAGDYRYEDNGKRFVVRDSTLFYLHETEKKLIALNFKLEPTTHPFADAYNEHYKKLLKPYRITLHPTLPFALVESTIDCIISWKDNKKDLIPFAFHEEDRYSALYSFSHDGRYIAWCSISKGYPAKYRPRYWVANIDERVPGYIVSPRLLGPTFSKFEDEAIATAWARNPDTYVVSEPEGLFWWHVE